MNFLDIGEVARASGLPTSTLRYYEEIQLIASVARRGLRRQYEPEVLKRLALISMARSAGFSLNDVAPILGQKGELSIPREELRLRADALEDKAAEMVALASIMRHVADCPAPSHVECPSFQKLLRVGVKYQSRSRNRRRVPRRSASLT